MINIADVPKQELIRDFPSGFYNVRIAGVSKPAVSDKGHLGTKVTLEVVAPFEVQTESGTTVVTAGRKGNIWTGLEDSADKPWSFRTLKAALDKAGFQWPDQVDENDPAAWLTGFMFETYLEQEKILMRKPLTAADYAAGKRQGDPILDSDGKEIVLDNTFRTDWKYVRGPATVDANGMPY